MSTRNLGPVTAYAFAVRGGFEGTQEEFEQKLNGAMNSYEASTAASALASQKAEEAQSAASMAQAALEDARALSGISLASCTGLGIQYGPTQCQIGWTDPDDIVLSGSTIAKWGKTVLIRKAGSYPSSHEDGVEVASTSTGAEVTTKNYYRDHLFIDSGLEEGTMYYYKLFTQSASGVWNNLDGNNFRPYTNLSFTTLSAFIRNGHATDVLSLGQGIAGDDDDPLHSEYPNWYMRVEAFDYDTPADESLTHSVRRGSAFLLATSTTAITPLTTQFDAPENEYGLVDELTFVTGRTYYKLVGSTYTAMTENVDWVAGKSVAEDGILPVSSFYRKNDSNMKTYGSNRYDTSNIDQWLSSDKPLNQWFSKKTIWDKCTTALSGRNGFLRFLNADFRNALLPVKIVTNMASYDGGGKSTITRLMFLNSMAEMYGGNEGTGQLSYYVGDSSNALKKKATNSSSSPQIYWLRSPNTSGTYRVCYVQASGASDHGNAGNSYGISPACALG